MLSKGERTKIKILKGAMKFASTQGISQITIGEVSKITKMSRTGVISHFESKEDMQISILKYSEKEFIETVIKKSYDDDALKHLRKYFKNWVSWVDRLNFETKASCPFIKAIIDYQDRDECLVLNTIKNQQKELINYIESLFRKCQEQGYFHKDHDPSLFSYQAYSFYLGHNISKNLVTISIANKNLKLSIEELINSYLS